MDIPFNPSRKPKMKHITKIAAGLAALVILAISVPANATLPAPADAISLKNAINNNSGDCVPAR